MITKKKSKNLDNKENSKVKQKESKNSLSLDFDIQKSIKYSSDSFSSSYQIDDIENSEYNNVISNIRLSNIPANNLPINNKLNNDAENDNNKKFTENIEELHTQNVINTSSNNQENNKLKEINLVKTKQSEKKISTKGENDIKESIEIPPIVLDQKPIFINGWFCKSKDNNEMGCKCIIF